VVATIIPVGLVLVVSDMSGLADLYAVGVVGAIATNLGATSTDRKVALGSWERGLMFFTFLIMTGIEISLLIEKPNARYFALTILVCGLVLRELARERAARRKLREGASAATAGAPAPVLTARSLATTAAGSTGDPMLCAVRGMGRTLDFALKEAEEIHRPLYLLFVREQTVITGEDRRRKWMDDEEAGRIFHYAKDKVDGKATMLPCYAVSDSAAGTIVDVAATVGASRLILGAPNRGALSSLLRGNIVREVSDLLPEDIELLVFA
jgi:nucleotide-binding universal stress UspA family protein